MSDKPKKYMSACPMAKDGYNSNWNPPGRRGKYVGDDLTIVYKDKVYYSMKEYIKEKDKNEFKTRDDTNE